MIAIETGGYFQRAGAAFSGEQNRASASRDLERE